MGFIRHNGRVIHIPDNQSGASKNPRPSAPAPVFSGSHHLAFAAGGALSMALSKRPKARLALNLASGAASIANGIQYGRQQNSGMAGVVRTVTNDFAGAAGQMAGKPLLRGATKALKSGKVRAAAKRAGAPIRNFMGRK
jgi:hypothetical protein